MQPSLVKFDTPSLISGPFKPEPSKKGVSSIEEVLKHILPSREWAEGDKRWIQFVSSTPGTRLDVVHLQEELDRRLAQRQAREAGICPHREELYDEAFDEIIRQTTVTCAERGLLLLKARDELRMTVKAYRDLYESSIAFGIRKAQQGETRRENESLSVSNLQKTISALKLEIESLKKGIEENEQSEIAKIAEEEKKHATDLEKIKDANNDLKEQLEAILSIPKKLP